MMHLDKYSSTATAARPLLIQSRDRIIKKSDYGITMQEREDCKNLVTDAKKQEEEDSLGEFIYRVRGVPEKFAVVKLHKPVRRQ